MSGFTGQLSQFLDSLHLPWLPCASPMQGMQIIILTKGLSRWLSSWGEELTSLSCEMDRKLLPLSHVHAQ